MGFGALNLMMMRIIIAMVASHLFLHTRYVETAVSCKEGQEFYDDAHEICLKCSFYCKQPFHEHYEEKCQAVCGVKTMSTTVESIHLPDHALTSTSPRTTGRTAFDTLCKILFAVMSGLLVIFITLSIFTRRLFYFNPRNTEKKQPGMYGRNITLNVQTEKERLKKAFSKPNVDTKGSREKSLNGIKLTNHMGSLPVHGCKCSNNSPQITFKTNTSKALQNMNKNLPQSKRNTENSNKSERQSLTCSQNSHRQQRSRETTESVKQGNYGLFSRMKQSITGMFSTKTKSPSKEEATHDHHKEASNLHNANPENEPLTSNTGKAKQPCENDDNTFSILPLKAVPNDDNAMRAGNSDVEDECKTIAAQHLEGLSRTDQPSNVERSVGHIQEPVDIDSQTHNPLELNSTQKEEAMNIGESTVEVHSTGAYGESDSASVHDPASNTSSHDELLSVLSLHVEHPDAIIYQPQDEANNHEFEHRSNGITAEPNNSTLELDSCNHRVVDTETHRQQIIDIPQENEGFLPANHEIIDKFDSNDSAIVSIVDPEYQERSGFNELHTENNSIYQQLQNLPWVMGYHSQGRSISVYANLDQLDEEQLHRQLTEVTEQPWEKFKMRQNTIQG